MMKTERNYFDFPWFGQMVLVDKLSGDSQDFLALIGPISQQLLTQNFPEFCGASELR